MKRHENLRRLAADPEIRVKVYPHELAALLAERDSFEAALYRIETDEEVDSIVKAEVIARNALVGAVA